MALDDAGRRDKLVTIQSRPSADTVDAGGFPVDGTFSNLLPTVWMSKKDMAEGNQYAETYVANQDVARVDTEWQMAYRADMDPDVIDVPKLRRILYKGRVYDITRAVLMSNDEGKGIKLMTQAASGV